MNIKLKKLFSLFNPFELINIILILILSVVVLGISVENSNLLLLSAFAGFFYYLSNYLFLKYKKAIQSEPESIEPVSPFELTILASSFFISGMILVSHINQNTIITSFIFLFITIVQIRRCKEDLTGFILEASVIPVIYSLVLAVSHKFELKYTSTSVLLFFISLSYLVNKTNFLNRAAKVYFSIILNIFTTLIVFYLFVIKIFHIDYYVIILGSLVCQVFFNTNEITSKRLSLLFILSNIFVLTALLSGLK